MKYQLVQQLLPNYIFFIRGQRKRNMSVKEIGMTRAILSTMLERLQLSSLKEHFRNEKNIWVSILRTWILVIWLGIAKYRIHSVFWIDCLFDIEFRRPNHSRVSNWGSLRSIFSWRIKKYLKSYIIGIKHQWKIDIITDLWGIVMEVVALADM